MKIPSRKKTTDFNYICLCNAVTQTRIEDAIRAGATTLDAVFDKTSAGVGGCGGSCRPDIKCLLDAFNRDGRFPQENPRRERLRARSRRS
jgi:bacterioferritin-associated ferredoxin